MNADKKFLVWLVCLLLMGCTNLYTYEFHAPGTNGLPKKELSVIDNIGGCNWCLDFIWQRDEINWDKEIDPREECWQNDLCTSPYILLQPGLYTIGFSYRARKTGKIFHEGTVELQLGHTYQIVEESCIGFGSCDNKRMKSYTADVWLEDIETGKVLVGCRQGLGCAPTTVSLCKNRRLVVDPSATACVSKTNNGLCKYLEGAWEAACEPHSVADCGALPLCSKNK
jgi:hypothetical protein